MPLSELPKQKNKHRIKNIYYVSKEKRQKKEYIQKKSLALPAYLFCQSKRNRNATLTLE